MLGIPDFRTIAKLYLDGAPGIASERFGLFEVYRYSHGVPECFTFCNWPKWQTNRKTNIAPKGRLPQLHKSLFDAPNLLALFEQVGLKAKVFNYAFPGESHTLNLGVVAGNPIPDLSAALAAVPNVEIFINRDTIRFSDCQPDKSDLLVHAIEWAKDRSKSDPLTVRARGKLKRWMARFS